jgi:RHS repeat-associated protein
MKWRYRGGRHYELSNHLGNVQVVVTDKKIAHSFGGVDWAYYTVDVYTASDYGAFGQDIEERSFERAPEKGYRYGMNGQEKDDDVADGVFSAQYWEYDSRIGRRWNVDPVVNPSESSYACFQNNPILLNDPNGRSGIATIEGETVTITSKIFVYGSGATKDIANNLANNMQNVWNSANGTVKIDNKTYRVKFVVTAEYVSEKQAQQYAQGNQQDGAHNHLINFARVENGYENEARTDPAENRTEGVKGGNSMMFGNKHVTKETTTGAHEFGHGLGREDHEGGYAQSLCGQPGIMATKHAAVEAEFTQDPKLGDTKFEIKKVNGQIQITNFSTANKLDTDNKRKVTQSDIDKIFTKKVVSDLKKSGKANLGDDTNRLYDSKGVKK